MTTSKSDVVFLSTRKFLLGCVLLAAAVLFLCRNMAIPSWVLAVEVFLTVIALFVFGSIKYQIDKNVLTYGAVLIITATFFWPWWNQAQYTFVFSDFFHRYILSLHGLDELIHAHTMLFILGLTLFVAVIAQTRLLETVSFSILEKFKGAVVPTVGILAAVVSFSSGILDGVSMIGLMIRTLVIILILARAKSGDIIYAVIISTVVTTVCGMWLAYGEPPNLIMKANLHPYLDNAFFLRYCLPVAIGSYVIVFFNMRKRLKDQYVDVRKLDVLDAHIADVRFLQATIHGEVLTPVEFVEEHEELLGHHAGDIKKRLFKGEPLGEALIAEHVPEEKRKKLLGMFVSEELGDALDKHYRKDVQVHEVSEALKETRRQRIRAQMIGGLSFIPFIGLLVWHAIDHDVPLFWASFAGFGVALFGIFKIRKMTSLALGEAVHEFKEYLFLLPLFFSITLLQKSGFFEMISTGLQHGIDKLGTAHMAYLQFTGAAFLSALLDNNVVADFAGRALHGLSLGTLHLFAMAQIAGYAAGGCWTHIGSAQSVVAYSFIKKEVSGSFTPFRWIKEMTPVILEIFVLMTLVIYGEAWLFHISAR